MSTITEKTMHLGIEEMQSIFGQHDKYIRKIEDNLKEEKDKQKISIEK